MKRRRAFPWILALLGAALLLGSGYLLSLALLPTPQIAVIRVEGDIWGSYTASVSKALREAKDDPAVRAVVLDISSPGGEVTASEGLYFDILNLRDRVPVVASVNEMAASGAYYISSAAEQIYSKPASMVGNIGVISFLPDPPVVEETLITTGPFKRSGGTQVEYIRQMEMLKQTFLRAVLAQRSDRLKVGPETLSRGEIYLGLQAQRLGLVDQIGSHTEAIAAAARLAQVRHYEMVDRTPELPEESSLFGYSREGRSTAASLAELPEQLPPGFYYRYVEPFK